jgi:predicted ATPase
VTGKQAERELLPDMPTGTVTFLMTDVEGSTQLWQRDPGTAQRATERQEELIRDAVKERAGALAVEQGEGDSVVAAFARPADALAAALASQQALLAESWPDDVHLRVRMALSTGEGRLHGGGRYFGLALNRCARIRALARGAQVLLSQTTADLTRDALPRDVELLDRGLQKLRSLDRPERVFELRHPDLPTVAEPLTLPGGSTLPVPVPLTSFIGRGSELAEIRHALQGTRLMTLTGAGGSGKTRLAIELAAGSHEDYADGVFLVDLVPAEHEGLVARLLVRALGLAEESDRVPLQTAAEHLQQRRALLVLDNCEHVLGGVAETVEFLLPSCPGLRVLATSRHRLEVAGELAWSVPPLGLPGPRALAGEEVESDAVALFLDRARRVRPTLVAGPEALATVAKICRALDGLPLAIELAAARVAVLSLAEIEAGLSERFRVLGSGPRSAPSRQRTLRGSLDWSHELLTPAERILFRRLGVFSGGFTRERAEGVCSGEGIDRGGVLDLIAQLLDRSLVTAEELSIETRYRMLETVRAYAVERLEQSGEAETIRGRHLDMVVTMAAGADALLAASESGARGLEREAPNVRAALEFAAVREPAKALAIAAGLCGFWQTQAQYRDGREACERALAAAPPGLEPRLRALTLWGAGFLAQAMGDLSATVAHAEEAIKAADASGDPYARGLASLLAGNVLAFTEPHRAQPLIRRSVELLRDGERRDLVVYALACDAFTEGQRDRWESARAICDRAGQLAQLPGDAWALAWIEFVRSWAGLWTGALADAREHGERSAALAAEGSAVQLLSDATAIDAMVHQGAVEEARELALQRLERIRDGGAALALPAITHGLAAAALAEGDLEAARRYAIAMSSERPYMAALGHHALGEVALLEGRSRDALEQADALERNATRIDNARLASLASQMRGRAALLDGEPERAGGYLYAALAVQARGGFHLHSLDTLDALAALAGAAGEWQRAGRLLAAAAAARRALGAISIPIERDWVEQLSRAALAALGDRTLAAEASVGEELTLDAAVAYARSGERTSG